MMEDKDLEYRAESSTNRNPDYVPTYTTLSTRVSNLAALAVPSLVAPTQHTYVKRELSVTVGSYAPNPQATPLFVNSTEVVGTVALSLAKREAIKEISVKVIFA